MKKTALVIALAIVAMLFAGCKKKEETSSTVAMIVKNGSNEYWQQVESAFRAACQEKNLVAAYFRTTDENAWQEQVAAVEQLRSLSGTKLKGIIYAPSKGANGECADAEVAALANELGIPVIILDSRVNAGSPLANRPYIGTDDAAAGRMLAQHVTADEIAGFALSNSPGVERGNAFKELKPNTNLSQVTENAAEQVQAAMNDYQTFVFFNGTPLPAVLPMLKQAGKKVYTFDVYESFLDELIAGSHCLKGILAQNTFLMARKAVDAVMNNATEGEIVPTFFITKDNLSDPAVKPFLDFYHKNLPDVPPTDEVRLTEQYIVTCRTSGDTLLTATQSFVWEDGILQSVSNTMYNAIIGTTTDLGEETYLYDADGNCIENHYLTSSTDKSRYFTYVDGRMTRAIELDGADTTYRVDITAYTPDGYLMALTVKDFTLNKVTDYQFTWQDGDAVSYTMHTVEPAGETETYTIEYDDYPNVRTGMPLTSEVFDPQMICSTCSKHNWQILNNVPTYSNGRLVKNTNASSASLIVDYYTYSDGTTGRE